MPASGNIESAREVLITGVGLLTPVGHSAWATARALLDGRTTADRLAELEPDLDAVSIARATAGVSLAAHSAIDPAIDLAERAARQALADAAIDPDSPIDLFIGSSKGAVMSLVAPRREDDRSACLLEGPHGFLASRLRDRLPIACGSVAAPVAACATSLVALERAYREVALGRCERALVVAVESALHPIFIRSYARLGALAPTSPPWLHVARPLDSRRDGFTLCECAAAVVLEAGDQTGAMRCSWARLVGAAAATEPFDLVRSPDAFRALTRVVGRVTAGVDQVALVQPHAPGTPDNDDNELAAIAAALGELARDATIYASKGAIGHGLGASGLVNVVLSCMFGRIGRTPPMPWLEEPVDSVLALDSRSRQIRPGAHVCVSAGFGGHVAAVSLIPR